MLAVDSKRNENSDTGGSAEQTFSAFSKPKKSPRPFKSPLKSPRHGKTLQELRNEHKKRREIHKSEALRPQDENKLSSLLSFGEAKQIEVPR